MDDEAKKALSDRFFKERRLFLAVSAVLLAHQILQISVASDLEGLGLHFHIEKPERLIGALWAVWVWGLVCYLQQLYSLQPFKLFPIDRRNATLNAFNSRYMMFQVRRRVRASFHRQVARAHRTSFQVLPPRLVPGSYDPKKGTAGPQMFNLGIELRWHAVPDDPGAVDVLDDRGATGVSDLAANMRWTARHGNDLTHRDGARGRGGSIEVPIEWVAARRWIGFAATLWTWIATSFVSDYIAPLLVGLAPLAIEVSRLSHAPF